MYGITSGQLHSALRHVYTATAAIVAALSVVGLSQGDATAIGNAVQQIGNGIVSIAVGVGTLIPIATGIYAGWTARRKSLVAEVASVPGTQVKIPEQAIADALPSNVKGPADGPMK